MNIAELTNLVATAMKDAQFYIFPSTLNNLPQESAKRSKTSLKRNLAI